MEDRYEPDPAEPPTPPWMPSDGRDDWDVSREAGPPGLTGKLNTTRRVLFAVGVSLALLVIAGVGLWWFVLRDASQDQAAPLTPPVSLIELATEYPELGDILQDPKLDSVYKEFLLAYQTGGGEKALELAEQRGLLNANGDLRLTLELDSEQTADLQRELEENGIQVTAVSGNMMDIAVPLGLMERLMAAGTADNLLSTITNLNHVVRIRLPQVNINDQTGGSTPNASPPALGTPSPPATPADVPVGPLRVSYQAFMAGLGVLLCVVAPLLMGVGVFLLYSGMGLSRRKPAPGGPSAAPVPESLPPPGGEMSGRSSASQVAQVGLPPAQEALPPVEPPPAARPQAAGSPPAGAVATVPDRWSPTLEPPAASAPTQKDLFQAGPTLPPVATGLADPAQAQENLCPQCGHSNRSGARFCASCGGPLGAGATQAEPPTAPQTTPEAQPALERPTYCWNCGQRLRPTSQFCPYCGDRV